MRILSERNYPVCALIIQFGVFRIVVREEAPFSSTSHKWSS